jgi:hypothetical protein
MNQLILDYYSKNYSSSDIKKCIGRTAKKHKITDKDVENIIVEYLELRVSDKELDIPDDVLKIILLNTDINKLSAACRTNTRSIKICNTKEFWENKFKQDLLIVPDIKHLYNIQKNHSKITRALGRHKDAFTLENINFYKNIKITYAKWIYEYEFMANAVQISSKLVEFILKFPKKSGSKLMIIGFDYKTKTMKFLPEEIFSVIRDVHERKFSRYPSLHFIINKNPFEFKIVFKYQTLDENDEKTTIVTKQEFINNLAQVFYYYPDTEVYNEHSKIYIIKN